MNLIDAIKTERNVQRKGWHVWYSFNKLTGVSYTQSPLLNKEDILADDWQVQFENGLVLDSLNDLSLAEALSISDSVSESGEDYWRQQNELYIYLLTHSNEWEVNPEFLRETARPVPEVQAELDAQLAAKRKEDEERLAKRTPDAIYSKPDFHATIEDPTIGGKNVPTSTETTHYSDVTVTGGEVSYTATIGPSFKVGDMVRVTVNGIKYVADPSVPSNIGGYVLSQNKYGKYLIDFVSKKIEENGGFTPNPLLKQASCEHEWEEKLLFNSTYTACKKCGKEPG